MSRFREGKMSGETDAAPSNPRMVSSLFIWLLHKFAWLLGDHVRQHVEFWSSMPAVWSIEELLNVFKRADGLS